MIIIMLMSQNNKKLHTLAMNKNIHIIDELQEFLQTMMLARQ